MTEKENIRRENLPYPSKITDRHYPLESLAEYKAPYRLVQYAKMVYLCVHLER